MRGAVETVDVMTVGAGNIGEVVTATSYVDSVDTSTTYTGILQGWVDVSQDVNYGDDDEQSSFAVRKLIISGQLTGEVASDITIYH